MVHKGTKFHCQRTQHEQVLGKNTVYTVFCMRLFVIVYIFVWFGFIVVHRFSRFHCQRTQHKQVIGTNTVYCLRLFVVVYILVTFALSNDGLHYVQKVLSFFVLVLTSQHTLLVYIIMYGIGCLICSCMTCHVLHLSILPCF